MPQKAKTLIGRPHPQLRQSSIGRSVSLSGTASGAGRIRATSGRCGGQQQKRAELGPVVLLCAEGPLGAIVQNAFCAAFKDVVIIREPAERKIDIVSRRARLIGWFGALSQVAAGLLMRSIGRLSRNRLARVIDDNSFETTPPDVNQRSNARRIDVVNINSVKTYRLLGELNPSVVAVYGTRLLKSKTLAATAAPFVNYHAGLTPDFRGQHPGYWALASGRSERAGITIHFVDRGVDTGDVITQAATPLDRHGDNITTFQYRQMATGLPLFLDAVARVGEGEITPGDDRRGFVARATSEHVSRNWLPPTLGQYLSNGFRRGVW